MISINKYGQNIDLSKIVAVNGTKSISLDGLTLNETLIINVTKGMKFKSSLEENDLKIEFTDIDGSIFEVILKDMATLLAENDTGEKLVEIVQTDDNKVLASITDITTALAAAAAGAEAPGAGNNGTNSDSAANNDGFADGLNLTPNVYDNATLPASINLAAALPVDETRRNFAPTIETIAPQSVDEDNSLLINYIATDANNDALTATVTATNGTAVITEAGQILFTPNANFNGAAEIVLTITDGLLTTIQTIAITVNPVNDVPTISADATTVIEDAAALLTTGGTITVVDVDVNESFVTPQTNVAGLYGTFNIAANGVWTYSADNTQSAIQALGETETLTETFAVTSLDGTATSNVVVTIQGTNDTPIILEQVNSLYEDTILNGQLISSDVDTALIDLKYSTSSTIEGFVLNEDGSYSFDANNYDYLAAGETLNLSIPIIVTDDFAATASSFLNITLTGTNDRPVIQNIDANGTSTVASSGGGTTTTPDPDLIIGRSAEVDGEVFLGGKFIELGIHSSGSFGTSGSRPAGFYGTDSDSRLGMTSDSDGFDEGNDLRIDYFLPGSPEEAWNLGYKIGGSTFVGTNAGLEGESEIPFSVTNTTSGNTLSASGTGVFNATLQTNMSISFDANADYYKTTIVLTNNSASTIDDVRYMKSFDPDNTVYLGGDYTTINKIESTFEAGDGKAIVSATSLAGDNYNTLSGEQSKIFLFSDDSRAKVTTYGFSLRDVYDSNVYDNTLSKGSVVTDDIAISIAFDVGTLAPGESVTISYYTGLTNRDITTVIDEIETRKVIYETHDLRTDLLIDDLNQDSTNSTFEGKISISDLDTNDLDLHTLSILKDAAGKNIIDITGPKDSSGNDIITADDITVNVSKNPDNTWNYSIEGNFTALKEGEELTLKFQYVADDTRGFDGTDGINESSISEAKEIKLTITGTNDRPVVSDISSSITETGNEVLTTFESTLNVSDDDINDTHTFHLVAGTVTLDGVSVADTFVSVYLDSATSEWKYKVEGDFNYLSKDEITTLEFKYYAQDDSSGLGESNKTVAKTVTLTVIGTNDKPTIKNVFISENEVNGTQNFTGQLTAKDLDINDVPTFEMVSTGGNNKDITNDGRQFESIELNGVFAKVISTKANLTDPSEIAEDRAMLKAMVIDGISINSTGLYTVTGNFDALTAQESVTLRFAYKVNDNSGSANAETQSKLVELTIQGTNDAPVASASTNAVSSDNVYVGQLVASDTDLNDALTYTYDNTSVSMTLTVAGLNNLDTLMAFNNASTISALTELKAAASSFVSTGSLAGLLTITPSTIAIGKTAVSTLLNFLNTNSGLDDIKDFIVDNRDVIIANTELEADDITLIQGLLTTTNISALNSLFTTYETLMSTPSVQAAVQAILADNVISSAELSALSSNTTVQTFVANVQSLLAANTAILSLIDIPTIVSKLQSIIEVDTANGEVSVTAEIPSTTADVMIALDATTGEYTVTNPYLATLPDNTQVEVKFDYTVTDSAGASDDSTAAIMITSENVDKVSASLDDNGTLVMGDEKDIDMASLLSNITSNINVSDIDSIDLSSNEHILSNLTIADFQEMVSDSSSNTLEIKGENNDIIKLDPAIWLKDTTDTDTNSVVDNADDNFISYKATTTDSQVLTLLIDKDIIVQDI